MKVAIGQFGGPTPVFNASLYGAFQHLEQNGVETFGVVSGATGLLQGDFIRLKDSSKARWLTTTPGAALGAGRAVEQEETVERGITALRDNGFDALVVIGGNGTMQLGRQMAEAGTRINHPLQVVGVPKTVDNDIRHIDHSPGYISAAQFMLEALRDLTIDLRAMRNFETVRVVEVMGRHVGWLAFVAHLLPSLFVQEDYRLSPIVLVPEREVHLEALIQQIEVQVSKFGQALLVVAEGVRVPGEGLLTQQGPKLGSTAQSVLGGIGAWFASYIRQHMNVRVRYENLGLLPRCFRRTATERDRTEAVDLGVAGADLLLQGSSGCMVGYQRSDQIGAQGQRIHVPLESVAGIENPLPELFINRSDSFETWLRPLLDWNELQAYPSISLERRSSDAT